jgi:hypothetical protein
MFENTLVFPGDITDSHGPDNTVMIELITDPMGLFIGKRQGKPAV